MCLTAINIYLLTILHLSEGHKCLINFTTLHKEGKIFADEGTEVY